MNIIDTLKGEAFQAFHRAQFYIEHDDRDDALTQWGRGIGFMQALDKLVGCHADTAGLVALRREIEYELDRQLQDAITRGSVKCV